MKITVEKTSVYGRDMIYPVCKKAHLFTQFAGLKTLRPSDIKIIKALGFEIELKKEKI
jgi:hypothetical protein